MTAAAKARPRAAARPTSQSMSKQRLRLWLHLLRATRAIEAELRERLRVQFAMTLPQFDVMAALYREEEGLRMTELSRRLLVSNGNVTGIVERLVNDGLIVRESAASDRRSFVVRLTPKGEADFAAIAKAHQDWVNGILADFDAQESEMIIEHLAGLPARIRNGGKRP
jgi:DNA-binding MarR family transcriptional regulator